MRYSEDVCHVLTNFGRDLALDNINVVSLREDDDRNACNIFKCINLSEEENNFEYKLFFKLAARPTTIQEAIDAIQIAALDRNRLRPVRKDCIMQSLGLRSLAWTVFIDPKYNELLNTKIDLDQLRHKENMQTLSHFKTEQVVKGMRLVVREKHTVS